MKTQRPAWNGSRAVRLMAWGLAGAAAIAAAVAVAGRNEGASEGEVRLHPYPADALVEELARCQILDAAAAEDPSCRAAWVRHLDRFVPTNPVRGRARDGSGQSSGHAVPPERPADSAKDQDRLAPETPAGTGGL